MGVMPEIEQDQRTVSNGIGLAGNKQDGNKEECCTNRERRNILCRRNTKCKCRVVKRPSKFRKPQESGPTGI